MSEIKTSLEKLAKKVTGQDCKAPSLSTVLDKFAEKYSNVSTTYQNTAPSEAISDGGIHIVVLDQEPQVKYNGYIYFITEEE